MIKTLINIFKVPELRNKILFTLGLLAVYRIGFHVPLAGVNQEMIAEHFGNVGGGLGRMAEYFAVFTGGSLAQSTIFGLGIMPYITAAIIFELLVTVIPSLEKLHKEGETGRRKIREYTRYATVLICVIQAMFWLKYISSQNLVYPEFVGSPLFIIMGVLALTTGTIFLMWLGEQIDEYGIGNGISLIITAGILSQMPGAIIQAGQMATTKIGGAAPGEIGPQKIVFLVLAFVFVVAGSILITQGQRRIPIQQAKQMRGRRIYGGMRHYLPLRVNHGGVMPIIFASSLMLFPQIIFDYFAQLGFWGSQFFVFLATSLQDGEFLYTVVYVAMVYFFAYFWTTVQFKPKEMSEQLRDYGSFIPGLRPGKRTEDYLERVMERITYAGAAFLALIAVIPSLVARWIGIPFGISTFLGGTGLLIVVSVILDLVQRIEANLMMRNYPGFLSASGGGRIKGAHG
ncbi:MAG: preprotein translocase subunit SecY [Phycisphaerae bacterium]|nr:preprotein translocase subunit SecY [Phycisphaerae bacterium]